MRNKLTRCLATLSLLGLACGAAQAQPYPSKPITLVVGYPAGGPVDSLARALGQELSARLKQPVLIDNRAGANEIVASQFVARARPDGHTLFVSTEAPLTQNQFLYKKLGYVPETDLVPVSELIKVPMVLTVRPDFPAQTAQEFIAVARARKGEQLVNYASAGVGGVTHLPMAMFAKNEGFQWSHVPYKGAAPILPDLMAGQVDATMLAVAFLAPYIQDKKVRGLAVSAQTRPKILPDVPTFKELGITDVQASFIIGLTAPKGLPAPIAEQLAEASRAVLFNPTFRERNLDPYAYTAVGSAPSAFAAYLASDRKVQQERVRASGATLD
ncbi:MAG: tripartite tricarboxylate transporter substrate binding protein [Comamonas sp.]